MNNLPTDLQDGQIAWNEVASKPLLYTKNQVDSIRQGVVDSMTNYVDSAVISQAHSQLVANRNLQVDDCGKTIYVKGSTSILTVPANAEYSI
ncbi:MAG: hypothetical protein U5L96_10835 [Owenweeksia sp.]|nr:hypothetical protein [Owenweeksia sp.]